MGFPYRATGLMSIVYRIYKFAEFELDEEEEKLFKNKEDVLLTDTEYRVLLILLLKREKTISTADLFEEIWGLDSDVEENNVPAHIKGIRNKFGEPNRERFIKTERGKKGYKFIFEPVIVETKKDPPNVDEVFAETPAEDSNNRFAQEVPPTYAAPAIESKLESQST